MFDLGCIVSKSNVYINIQESVLCTDLDFNLDDNKKWKPFLT